MSLVIKKIGKQNYAYLASRSGKKVTQTYLGPTSRPDVQAKLKALQKENFIPDQLAYLFWDAELSSINLKKNERYIIERVLDMGNLDAFNWLQKMYPTQAIIEVCEISRKISEKSKNFWRIWLEGGEYVSQLLAK